MEHDRPWLAHYDPGVPASIDYPAQALFAFLEDSARRWPDRACTILRGKTASYAMVNDASDRLAGALADLGVRKGDRVGIFMANVPEFVVAFYGILKAGGVVVAVNPLYTLSESVRQINDAGLQVMFVTHDLYETVRAAKSTSSLRTLIVAGAVAGASLPQAEPAVGNADFGLAALLSRYEAGSRPRLKIGPDDTALFQYSGGTTGVSKAAVASHRGVVANTLQFRTWLFTLEEAHEVFLMAIPLYHAYGMIAGMSLAIALGASLALVQDARKLVDLIGVINEYHPTVFPGVPSLYVGLCNHPDVATGGVDLQSIRVCISGSTALLRETKERFESLSGGKICEGYGLSEAPVVTHCNPLLGANKIGSIGMPMPDVDCRIVDPENGDKLTAPGEPGELVLRGPQVMSGYHNMPEETAGALRRLWDGETWLFTGDIVRMDSDGYFYVVDRKKELIKPGGFQVWPREVEEVLAAHPKVLEVGVAGIPDPIQGESVKAWIVLKPGAECGAEELRDWCRQMLAAYKVPSQIEFRRELPKSTVGKILRRELVRQQQDGPRPDA